jgi:hypothetical protein
MSVGEAKHKARHNTNNGVKIPAENIKDRARTSEQSHMRLGPQSKKGMKMVVKNIRVISLLLSIVLTLRAESHLLALWVAWTRRTLANAESMA